MDGAAGMQERQTVTLQPLEDEAFAAEQTGAEAFRKRDSETHAFGRTKKRVLLRQQIASDLSQMNRYDFARIRRAESHALFPSAAVLEHGHEHRFAGEKTLARAQQRSEKTAVLLRAIAENGLHLDAVLHVHHATGFSHGRFHGVQLHLHILHFVTKDFVIDFVHRRHK